MPVIKSSGLSQFFFEHSDLPLLISDLCQQGTAGLGNTCINLFSHFGLRRFELLVLLFFSRQILLYLNALLLTLEVIRFRGKAFPVELFHNIDALCHNRQGLLQFTDDFFGGSLFRPGSTQAALQGLILRPVLLPEQLLV